MQIMPSHEEDDVENFYNENLEAVQTKDITVENGYRRRSFLFSETSDLSLYKSSQKRNSDVVSIISLAVIFYINVITRFNLEELDGKDPISVISLVCLIVLTIIFTMFLSAHLIVYRTSKKDRYCYAYQMSERCLHFWFRGRIEDIIGILAIITVGLYLVRRVMNGQCVDTNVWRTQSCNPDDSTGGVPTDQVLILYSLPICTQLVLRGISSQALVVCWTVAVLSILWISIIITGYQQIWTIAYSSIFMYISFEIELSMRNSFLNMKEMLIAEKLIRQKEVEFCIDKENHSNKVHHLEMTAKSEKLTRDQEQTQLICMMGNVAHDLKTPLHSIQADLEVLKAYFGKIPAKMLKEIKSSLQGTCTDESLDSTSIFKSLYATCKFMETAISRSQDHMKASSNIALVPIMETFELKEAINMSVICISHLQKAREVIVHPISNLICSHIISDKHWLSENTLCLLSNAIKYSHAGAVEVRVELVEIAERALSTSITTEVDTILRIRSQKSLVEKLTTQNSTKRLVSNSITDGTIIADDNIDISQHEESLAVDLNEFESDQNMRPMVLITVEDSGIGISKEMRQSLFQPFKQAQKMAGGTGLGLYSLSLRMEALGGTCGVCERTDGQRGSMFWFTFSYRPDESACSVPVYHRSKCVQTTTEEIKPRKILIMDDSLSILKVTTRLLMMNGHTVESVDNGFLGLERLKHAYETQEFDIVLTDLQMPIMDGFEATRRYREFEEEQKINDPEGNKHRLLFVGMSANCDDYCKLEALESGMDYFVIKPFAYKELLPILLKHQDHVKISQCIPQNIILSKPSGREIQFRRVSPAISPVTSGRDTGKNVRKASSERAAENVEKMKIADFRSLNVSSDWGDLSRDVLDSLCSK